MHYHSGKANVVADALSRKAMSVMASMRVYRWKMLSEVSDFDLGVEEVGQKLALCNLVARPTLLQKIVDAQLLDAELTDVVGRLSSGETMDDWKMSEAEGLRFMGRLCVPCDAQLKEEIFDQAHRSKFLTHPGCTKMYRDMRRMYWWKGMKREVAKYVVRCYTC